MVLLIKFQQLDKIYKRGTSTNGIIFLTSDNGPIKVIQFADWAINILPQPWKKDNFIKLTNWLHLPSVGTVGEIKERLKIHPFLEFWMTVIL